MESVTAIIFIPHYSNFAQWSHTFWRCATLIWSDL